MLHDLVNTVLYLLTPQVMNYVMALTKSVLREDAFVDGCPNQPDARHQTALCFLHWSTLTLLDLKSLM